MSEVYYPESALWWVLRMIM